jgi:hypothetical protein
MRSLSHLREDARWCVFREVASNTIPGDRTIVVYECECRIAIRLIESEPRAPDPSVAEVSPTADAQAVGDDVEAVPAE